MYVRGKPLLAEIRDQDHISLYSPSSFPPQVVQFLNDKTVLSKCLLDKSGQQRPPHPAAYDQCVADSVELTIMPRMMRGRGGD